jgi:hypothetical protein
VPPGTWELDGDKYSRCPLKLVTRKSYEYINAYNFMEKGFLPNAGGWQNQPAKFIEAVIVIQGVIGKKTGKE